jgi:hypothetical protein
MSYDASTQYMCTSLYPGRLNTETNGDRRQHEAVLRLIQL